MSEWQAPKPIDGLNDLYESIVEFLGTERPTSPQFEEKWGIDLEQLLEHTEEVVKAFLEGIIEDHSDYHDHDNWESIYFLGILVGMDIKKEQG